jgi:molecular chaperone HscB
MTDDRDHFERLGLPRRFALDDAEMERNYLARSREAHPDLAGDSPEILDRSARLNQAYAPLRDPSRRAEYLLKLLGGPSPTEVTQPPAEFLEEMLELRIAIAEAEDGETRTRMEKTLSERKGKRLEEVGELFDKMAELRRIREQLNALKFINGLIRDLHGD